MKTIGIDLGEDSVKIVELVQNKKSLSIHSLFEKKLSAQSNSQDRELESIEFIRSLFAKNDDSKNIFIMAIRQEKATVRKKTFPFSDRLKIQKSLSFEMEEDIPFDPDHCIFDYKTLQYVGHSAETLAIAVPKVHIEKIISLAKDFGIVLKLVTLEGFAFANLIEAWDEIPTFTDDKLNTLNDLILKPEKDTDLNSKFKKSADIYLNIGHKKTLLCAKINNRVVFIRSLMWGADSVIQELVKRYQIPYIEAQKNLQTTASLYLSKSNQSFEESNVSHLIEKCLRDMVRDLQMSFLEIESELHAEISSLYFTGGFSQLPHLGAFLTQQLEVPCNPVQLLNSYLNTSSQGIGTNLSEEKINAQFCVAAGIAIEGFKKPKNPALQFLKGDFLNQNSFLKTFWQNWGSLAQVGLAALVVLFSWTYFRESFSTELNDKGSEAITNQAKNVIKLPKKMANEKGVKKYIAQHRKQAQEMKIINRAAQMNSALDLLKKLSDVTPAKDQAKIDVQQISIADDEIKISGYANSPREISLLTSQLSTLSINRKVKEEPTNLSVIANRVAFSLSFKTDRGLN